MSTPTVNPDAVSEAVRELSENSEQYLELIRVLRDPEKRKDIGAMVTSGTGVVLEAIKDYKAAAPAVRDVTAALRSGSETSEFKQMSLVSKILTYVAILAPVLETLMYMLEQSSVFHGNSVWLSSLAIALKALLAGNYSTGRSRIKAAALSGDYEVIQLPERKESEA